MALERSPAAGTLEAWLVETNPLALAPMAEARFYASLICRGYKAEDIAENIGRSRAYVYHRRKLLELAPALCELLLEGALDATLAVEIARMPVALQLECWHELGERFPGGSFSFRPAAAFFRKRLRIARKSGARLRAAQEAATEAANQRLRAAREAVAEERARLRSQQELTRRSSRRQRTEKLERALEALPATVGLDQAPEKAPAAAESDHGLSRRSRRAQSTSASEETPSAAELEAEKRDPVLHQSLRHVGVERSGIQITSAGARVYINVAPPPRSVAIKAKGVKGGLKLESRKR